MATVNQAPVTKDFEIPESQRKLVVRGLEGLHASVSRAARAEKNEDIQRMREAEAVEIEKLILRFR